MTSHVSCSVCCVYVSECVAVCCSVLQYIAVVQYVAVCHRTFNEDAGKKRSLAIGLFCRIASLL